MSENFANISRTGVPKPGELNKEFPIVFHKLKKKYNTDGVLYELVAAALAEIGEGNCYFWLFNEARKKLTTEDHRDFVVDSLKEETT